MIVNYETLRLVFLAIGVIAILNWSRRGRRWRRGFTPRRQQTPDIDVAAIEHRLATVEQLEARVAELENRVDFAERLMAGRESAALPRG